MSLKLFRATGHSSILTVGETRVAPHPAGPLLAISAWIGFGCNVGLWRLLSGAPDDSRSLAWLMAAGILAGSICLLILSLLGWRRTFRPAATILMVLAGMVAFSAWTQNLPWDLNLLDRPLRALLPAPASLMRWQALAMVVGLVVLPVMLLWRVQVRRLPGPTQLRLNLTGMAAGVVGLLLSGYLLARHL